MVPDLPRLLPTSRLAPRERDAVAAFLAARPWFDFYWQCSLDDLARGLDNRSYRMGRDGRGLVMAIHFDEVDIFTTVGELAPDELALVASWPARAELHLDPAQADAAAAVCAARVRRRDTIRYYALDDAAAAAAVDARASALRPGDHDELRALFAAHYPETVLSSWMLSQPMVVVREEGRIVAAAGTLVAHERLRACHVGNFLTRPDLRGRGLAKVAARALLAELGARGIRRVMLGVYEGNAGAARLYEGLGFRLVEARPFLYLAPVTTARSA